MSDLPVPLAAIRQKRDQTIALLCDHFANDNLEAEELEALIDRAHQASTLAELDALVANLPAVAAPSPERDSSPAGIARSRMGEQSIVVAVMGGAERKGAWAPSREVNVIAVMGGVMLDFREARLDLGVTEVRIFALMGGVEIIVPPDVQVESSGIGIMGGFEHVGGGNRPVDLHRPLLRVVGLALMGGVEITERYPGETSKDARVRARDERRELREEHRQRRIDRGDPPL